MAGAPDPAPEFPQRLAALDTLLDHRVRLAICVLLSRYDRLSFSRLKELTAETDGSLGAHLRKLEDAGYAKVKKEFVGRKPTSWYSLSPKGMQALSVHLEALTDLLSAAAGPPEP
jgi:DNA-binding transcriptional ArsR family regulator